MNSGSVERHNIINSLCNLWKDPVELSLKEITGLDSSIFIRMIGEARSVDNSIGGEFIQFTLEYLPGGETILIDLPAIFLYEFLSELLPGNKKGWLSLGELAFLEYVFLKIISFHRESEIFGNVRFLGFNGEPKRLKEDISILFQIEFMKGVYTGLLHTEKALALKIIEGRREESPLRVREDIPLTIVLLLMEGDLDGKELDKLEPGCIIAFPDGNIRINNDGSIGGVIMVKTIDDEVFAKYDLDRNELIVNNPEKDNKGHEISAKQITDAIPVTLSIELKRIKTTIGELREILSGDILKSEIENPEHVIISANGKIIGRGKLVNIDGRLCVEVLSLEG